MTKNLSLAQTAEAAQLIELTNRHGMKIELTPFGATWLSCQLPLDSGPRDVLLGSPSLSALSEQQAFLGATVGRFANRIANSQFTLAGETFNLTANQGDHCLHGGKDNFSYRLWQLDYHNAQEACFSLTSADGDQGFPGELLISVTYRLTDDNEVQIEYSSFCNKACPVSLTNHAYFNLAGEDSVYTCLEHDLQLYSTHYLPLSVEGIPTGQWLDVRNTYFDFNQRQRIGRYFLQDEDQRQAGGYDHPMILEPARLNGQSIVASLYAPSNDVQMDISTTLPSAQLYTGNYLNGIKGKSRVYQNFSGVAIEMQYLPDGPNHPEWDDKYRGIQAANKTYSNKICYRFTF